MFYKRNVEYCKRNCGIYLSSGPKSVQFQSLLALSKFIRVKYINYVKFKLQIEIQIGQKNGILIVEVISNVLIATNVLLFCNKQINMNIFLIIYKGVLTLGTVKHTNICF